MGLSNFSFPPGVLPLLYHGTYIFKTKYLFLPGGEDSRPVIDRKEKKKSGRLRQDK